MVTVYFFQNFSKPLNSTLQPDSANGILYQCDFKRDFDIQSPIVRILNNKSLDVTEYTYCMILEFKRYYYVEKWHFNGGIWEAELSCDVLSTYKSQIGDSSAYILRCQAERNGDIVDTMYPCTGVTSLDESNVAIDWDITNGTFIVCILGGSGSYYLFYGEGLQEFFDYLYSDDYLYSVVGSEVNLTDYPELRPQLNPLQYIGSIKYIPTLIQPGSVTDSIKVGWGVAESRGYAVSEDDFLYQESFDVTIPKHPQNSRGNYLNLAPYSTYYFKCAGFGQISLDSTIMSALNDITVSIYIDIRTGDGTLHLHTAGATLGVLHGNVGVDVKQSQSVANGFSVTANALSVASKLSFDPSSLLDAASAVHSAIGDAASGQIPSVNSVGSSGSWCDLIGGSSLYAYFRHVAASDNEHLGSPLCELRQFKNIPGFVLPKGADISIPGTKSEQQELNSIINGGFVYE